MRNGQFASSSVSHYRQHVCGEKSRALAAPARPLESHPMQ